MWLAARISIRASRSPLSCSLSFSFTAPPNTIKHQRRWNYSKTDFIYINILPRSAADSSTTTPRVLVDVDVVVVVHWWAQNKRFLCKLPFLLTNTLPHNDFKKLVKRQARVFSSLFFSLCLQIQSLEWMCFQHENNKARNYLWETKRELRGNLLQSWIKNLVLPTEKVLFSANRRNFNMKKKKSFSRKLNFHS